MACWIGSATPSIQNTNHVNRLNVKRTKACLKGFGCFCCCKSLVRRFNRAVRTADLSLSLSDDGQSGYTAFTISVSDAVAIFVKISSGYLFKVSILMQ